MEGLVSFNMKIPASDKAELTRLAEELGIPPVTIVKSMIRKFVTAGGFPYEVKVEPIPQRFAVNWDSPLILNTKEENGSLIMPKEWRDDDDADDNDEY